MECLDNLAQKDNAIKSLSQMLAIYTNADSPSGKDPNGYEKAKAFLALSRAFEAAKETAGGNTEDGTGEADGVSGESSEVPPHSSTKTVEGGPDTMVSPTTSRTVTYTAEMCDECGRTDLDLFHPINKLVAGFKKTNLDAKADEWFEKKDGKECIHCQSHIRVVRHVQEADRSGPPLDLGDLACDESTGHTNPVQEQPAVALDHNRQSSFYTPL